MLEPMSPADLEAGLLMFFARPSLLQTWAEMFGHEWRHVGVTVETPDGLRVASYSSKKCFRLDDPHAILSAYSRIGVARVLDPAQVSEVERLCRRYEHFERADAPYTFSGVVFGPLHLYARQLEPGLMRTMLLFVVLLYCLLQQARYPHRTAFGCSTFAWYLIAEARSAPLRIPLSAHPDDEWAYATDSNIRDELYARWLCGPTELWRAVSPGCRTDLDLSGVSPRDDDAS